MNWYKCRRYYVTLWERAKEDHLAVDRAKAITWIRVKRIGIKVVCDGGREKVESRVEEMTGFEWGKGWELGHKIPQICHLLVQDQNGLLSTVPLVWFVYSSEYNQYEKKRLLWCFVLFLSSFLLTVRIITNTFKKTDVNGVKICREYLNRRRLRLQNTKKLCNRLVLTLAPPAFFCNSALFFLSFNIK